MNRRLKDELIHELITIAKAHGLSERVVRHPTSSHGGEYTDLERDNVKAQIHAYKGRSDVVVLIVGKPGKDFPTNIPHLRKRAVAVADFDQLDGDFYQNKNWLRGLRPFQRYKPARGFMIGRDLLRNRALRKEVNIVLEYAANR